MSEKAIRSKLIENGNALFRARKRFVEFTNNAAADRLLNDFERYPHAFVLACIMDRQVRAEQAWLIPYRLSQKLGSFSIRSLRRLSEAKIKHLMSRPQPLHRFAAIMGGLFYLAVRRINNQYGGNAARIWADKPSSADLVYRFLEFDGVGPKIATMAANILARDFKVPLADYTSIDISADIHVRRVFSRLGLCAADAGVEQIIYKARALHPSFPGLIDLPTWQIGRNWCGAEKPKCNLCYMNDLCPASSA